MSRFADIRVEWRVEEIERNLQRKADSHEISSLRSDVDNLERTNRQISSTLDGLRGELERLTYRLEELERYKQQQEESE